MGLFRYSEVTEGSATLTKSNRDICNLSPLANSPHRPSFQTRNFANKGIKKPTHEFSVLGSHYIHSLPVSFVLGLQKISFFFSP